MPAGASNLRCCATACQWPAVVQGFWKLHQLPANRLRFRLMPGLPMRIAAACSNVQRTQSAGRSVPRLLVTARCVEARHQAAPHQRRASATGPGDALLHMRPTCRLAVHLPRVRFVQGATLADGGGWMVRRHCSRSMQLVARDWAAQRRHIAAAGWVREIAPHCRWLAGCVLLDDVLRLHEGNDGHACAVQCLECKDTARI